MITDSVDGWLYPQVLDFIEQINDIHNNKGIQGNVVEIGVHHGKFFIPLVLIANAHKNIAIDLFDKQEENISHSGLGNLTAFKENCNRLNVKNVKIISGNSLRLKKYDIITDNEPIRLFSVDGGHSAIEVANDLKLAAECMCFDGVIIMDDVVHVGWDPVFCETLKFALETEFKPFLMGGNKLFLSKNKLLYKDFDNVLSEEEYYETTIKTSEERQLLKAKTFITLFPEIKLFSETV